MRTGALRTFLESVPEELCTADALGRGAGVRVAIIDSGVDGDHPDLRAAVTRHLEVRPAGGGFCVGDGEPGDAAGHGTACADIVGRLAPECEIWSIRALGANCRGDPRALLAALTHAIEAGVEVINLSLGTRDPRWVEPLRQRIAAAYRKDLLVVAASSNIPHQVSYPSVFTSLVAVESVFIEDTELFFFRPGGAAELEAPGVYIDAAWPGGGRKLVTGTSFACPHVSGHIARIVSANPGMRPFQIKTVLHVIGTRHAAGAEKGE